MTGREKRREIITVILVALVVAFLVSGLASYAYPLLFQRFFATTLGLSLSLLVLSVVSLYLVLVSSIREKRVSVSFPLAFHFKERRFLDIPRCPMSVHARVLFNQLSDTGRQHLAEYDNILGFFKSPLHRFLDHVVQEALADIVVFQRTRQAEHGDTRLDQRHFPAGFRDNKFLEDWLAKLDEKRAVHIPYLKKIECFGPNNAFFRVRTKGGELTLTWRIGCLTRPGYSEPFFPDEKEFRDAAHDFKITVQFVRRCHAWRVFSREVKRFLNWSDTVADRLEQHDWPCREGERLVDLLHAQRKLMQEVLEQLRSRHRDKNTE